MDYGQTNSDSLTLDESCRVSDTPAPWESVSQLGM